MTKFKITCEVECEEGTCPGQLQVHFEEIVGAQNVVVEIVPDKDKELCYHCLKPILNGEDHSFETGCRRGF